MRMDEPGLSFFAGMIRLLCKRVRLRWRKQEALRNEEARSLERASQEVIPAATYSPTQLPVQYHRP